MIFNQNKSVKVTLIVLLLFLVIIQGLKSRNIKKEMKLLQSKISAQLLLNSNLEAEYQNNSRSSNLSIYNQPFDLKEKTAEILSELENFNLELIDFSSSEIELNLNLSGDFKAVLNLIYYLETETAVLKVDEFKIKKNQDRLFFFLKLKKELI